MTIVIIKYIVGFAFIAIQLKLNSISSEVVNNCNVTSISGHGWSLLVANCSNKEIDRIPQSLGENIEVLDISDNTNLTLGNDDLRNYSNLLALIMCNLPAVSSFPPDFFKTATRMTTLNISYTNINNLTAIPSTIQKLNYSYCNLNSVNISHLNGLEYLTLRNCHNLHKFPLIPKQAPLKFVDMTNCPMTETNYSHLAPFCELRHFVYNSTMLNTPQHLKTCCELREWGKKYKIYGLNHQPCYGNHTEQKCNEFKITINEDAISEHDTCMKRIWTERFQIFIMFLFVFLLSLITLIVIAGVVFYRYKTDPKRRTERARLSSTGTPQISTPNTNAVAET